MTASPRRDVLRFALEFNALLTIICRGLGFGTSYFAWRFAFHYTEELYRPVHGKQAAYQHLFLLGHGHAL